MGHVSEHPNLLPAYTTPDKLAGRPMVRKAMLGREGSNIRITEGDRVLLETGGAYGDEGYVYQEYCEPPCVDGNCAMIGEECRGMGVREDSSIIVTDNSRFVPHYFDPA